MTDTVLLTIHANGGYSPDQIDDPMTLRDMIQLLTDAAERFGLDAAVVTDNPGNRYGARYGYVDRWADVEPAPCDDECDECGDDLDECECDS